MTAPPTVPHNSTDEPKSLKTKDGVGEDDSRAFISATSELLFVLLPFIVIGITLAHRCELRTIFFIPEWSIVSAVIIGQAIAKIASASLGKKMIKKEVIVLIFSILLVCFLVPILIILTIVLTSTNVSTTLAVAQLVFFLLSGFIFWAATVAEAF